MSYRFEPRVFPVAVPCLRSLLHALRDEVGLAVLDSAAGVPQRFSIVAIDPLGGPRRWNSLASLRTSIEAVHAVEGDELPEAFGGGFLGALSYELGACDEPLTLPDPAWKTPRIVGGLYVDYLCIDHQSGQAQLVLAENPGDDRAPLGQRRERWLSALARRSPLRAGSIRSAGPLVSHVPASEHERRIEEARACIAAGEIYQVNLARRYTRAVDAHPVDLFLRLRELNSAPFMAYLQWSLQDEEGEHQGALMSASPELLLEFDAGEALTRPIKGTIARQADPEGDRAARQRLLASDKERAELAMIVDLERNDLGRVAQPGGVRVGDFPRLESFATVHHLVADVRATCLPEVDAIRVLESLYPGGSITGAPKLRSMEIIAQLEQEGRGFFTGSLGALDFRGRAFFNILIRTLVWRPRESSSASVETRSYSGNAAKGEVSFHVGGGITWKSVAADEELETRWKGSALAAACSGADEAPETLGVPLPAAPSIPTGPA